MTDDVAGVWQALGLPGIFDVHTHFLPPNFEAKVWAQFDNAGPKIGREWPIRYRIGWQDRVELLRSWGVRRFPTLPYAHRPGVAPYLNEWAAGFKQDVNESLWSATFFPEESAGAYVDTLVRDGVEIFKIHVQVGEFWLDDPLLDPVWDVLSQSGTPIVVHAGSGPVGNPFTGPEPLARVLERWPTLRLIVAHLGAPEFQGFFDLADRFGGLHLDTTMVFTDFFLPFPDALRPRLVALKDRILFGSDLPTIPYDYSHALEGLTRLDLGDDWLRSVLWHNGHAMFGDPLC